MYWNIKISRIGNPIAVMASESQSAPELTAKEQRDGVTFHRNVRPHQVLESLSLTELPHYMDDEALGRFLEVAPVSHYMDLDNTLVQAAANNQVTLLRCLLGYLNPHDCPVTFDHYGYKTLEAQKMGLAALRALEYTLEKGTPETLGALFTHDTVVRTFLNSHQAYQMAANVNNPQVARRLQRAVYFGAADTTTQKQRLSCLKTRMADIKPDEKQARDSLRLEVRAIAANLSVKPKEPEQIEVLAKLVSYGIALGMDEETRHHPITFVDGRTPLRNLIEGPLRVAHHKGLPVNRSTDDIWETGKRLYVAALPNWEERTLTRQELNQAGEAAIHHNAIRIPDLDETMNQVFVGELALSFADNQAIINLVAEKLYEAPDPTARMIASQLTNTTPGKMAQMHGLMTHTLTKTQPLSVLDFDERVDASVSLYFFTHLNVITFEI